MATILVYFTTPTLDECIEAVRKQYYSGEGAIQWAGEAAARRIVIYSRLLS